MQRDPLGLRLRFALFFAALGFGGALCFALALWLGFRRSGGAVDGFVIAGLVGTFGLIGLATWVALLFDENVAKPILGLASDLHSRASSGVTTEIDADPARYLGTLAPAAQAIHTALEEARESQARAIAEKTRLMTRDKALLEAVVRDLAQGVVVISPNGQVILYNQAAAHILGDIGLHRPLERFLRVDPILSATRRLQNAGGMQAQSFLAATQDGHRILTGAVTAVQTTDDEQIGHVLIFHDATEDLRTHGQLDMLLAQLLERARRPAMNITALLDVLDSGDGLDPAQTQQITQAMRQEVQSLSDQVSVTATAQARSAARHWPIRATSIRDIFDMLTARFPDIRAEETDIFVNCDGHAITSILSPMLTRLMDNPSRNEFLLSVKLHRPEVQILLSWQGENLPQAQLESHFDMPLSDDYGPYTARDALDAHRTDMWLMGAGVVVLPLQIAEPTDILGPPTRPDFYDFNLPQAEGLATKLSDLTYVVFDTETTGLDPQHDDVVQIAGVRIVGGRVVEGEIFDRLVHPGRPIPPSSTVIHGISDEMVQNEPAFDAVAREFLAFSDGAVLVAHNAPFDMGFLKRLEPGSQLRFDHPVLCTARLSAALDRHKADHTLDGLAVHYDVAIADEHRHTALGDARATAEVFLKMIPILSARGVSRLQDALDRQTGR